MLAASVISEVFGAHAIYGAFLAGVILSQKRKRRDFILMKTYPTGHWHISPRLFHFNRAQSELCNHATSLEAHFKEHPPATIKKAQHEIEALTGIKRSPTQVRNFLKKTLAEMSQGRIDASQGRP